MTEWQEVNLEQVCIQITDGVHNTVKDDIDGECYLLSCKNIKYGSVFIGENERKINKTTLENLRKRTKTEKGDVLLSSVGTIGETAIVKEDNPVFEFQRSVAIFKPDKNKIISRFLFYFFNSKKAVLKHMAEGAVQQCLFITPLKDFKISLPPLDIQRKIAGILGALDDKIEVLRAQNKTLEQMAQAVFQSWFVDFDIVRAKAAGLPAADVCKKYHITPDIYDLFPSAFSADNLPLGWEKKKLGDILNISSGKRPPVKSENMTSDFYIPVYGGNGIGWYTKEPLISDGKKVIITGRVGTLGEVYRICSDAWISDNALIFYTSNDNYEFLYFWIKKINFSSYNRGAAQPLITQGDMKEIECVYPEIIIESFHNLTASCFDKIYENEKQIRTLEQTRDTLLSQLISGKLEV